MSLIAARIEKMRRLIPLGAFISHLKDEEISREIRPGFCFSFFNVASWLVFLF